MSKSNLENQLKNLSVEIESLSYDNIMEWVEENIIEIRNNNELVYTYGGPSIRIYIDCGVIKGSHGFSEPIFVSVETSIFEDLLTQY